MITVNKCAFLTLLLAMSFVASFTQMTNDDVSEKCQKKLGYKSISAVQNSDLDKLLSCTLNGWGLKVRNGIVDLSKVREMVFQTTMELHQAQPAEIPRPQKEDFKDMFKICEHIHGVDDSDTLKKVSFCVRQLWG